MTTRSIFSSYASKKPIKFSIKKDRIKRGSEIPCVKYATNQFKSYCFKSNILRDALLQANYKKNTINRNSMSIKVNGTLQASNTFNLESIWDSLRVKHI